MGDDRYFLVIYPLTTEIEWAKIVIKEKYSEIEVAAVGEKQMSVKN